MAFEEPSSFEYEPTRVRTRRAVVMAGVGLVWAAFMATLGLFALAVVVLVVAAAGVAWTLGVRVPRFDPSGAVSSARRGGRALAGGLGTTSRRSASLARRGGHSALVHGAAGARSAHSATRAGARTALAGVAVAAGATRKRLSAVTLPRPRPGRERQDPRVDRALSWNSQGIAFAKAGLHAEAIDAFDSALALLAETGDRHHEGQVLANLGVVHRQVGGDEAARFCWTKALERLEPGTPESERTAELLGVR